MTALDSAKWLLALMFFMALTAPSLMVKGEDYVNEPVEDICDVVRNSETVYCKKLPKPSRWKAFFGGSINWDVHFIRSDWEAVPEGPMFESGTELGTLYVAYNRKLKALPEKFLAGITVRRHFYMWSNDALTSLPAKLFDGYTGKSFQFKNNAKLAEFKAGVFDGATLSKGTVVEIVANPALKKIPKNLFSEAKVGVSSSILIIDNNALESLPGELLRGVDTALYQVVLKDNAKLASLGSQFFKGEVPDRYSEVAGHFISQM